MIFFVSIIIPCRNEAKFINRCLDSVLENNYPKDKMEILIVDGDSNDGSKEIFKEYVKKYPFVRIFNNPKKIKPTSLNIGVKNTKGDIIMIMDAHSVYKRNYISECVKYLKEYKADNVGGAIETISDKNTAMAAAITICLSNFFGVGNSYFRKGSKEPRWVDTVFGGCYRREVFEKIGYFNENLKRSQDLEFNLRLGKAGGKILLIPDVLSYYYPKSGFKDFFVHNFWDGFWAIYPLKFTKTQLKLRHYIPFLFILSMIISLILLF